MSTSSSSEKAKAAAPEVPKGEVKLPKTIEEMYERGKDADAAFVGMNRPTAGARTEDELPPKGKNPIQLYSLATPNGQKVGIALEEMGLGYDAFTINIMKQDQFKKGFVEVNPNSKIPCMMDHEPAFGGKPIRVFETGSILMYLAEKTGKFMPKDPRARVETMNWLMWQMGGQGPLFGQFGHYYRYAPRTQAEAIEYGVARYGMEVQRMYDVLDQHLAENAFVAGDEYTIADMAIFPWLRCVQNDKAYNAAKFLGTKKYKNVQRYFDVIAARPAVQKGIKVNGWD